MAEVKYISKIRILDDNINEEELNEKLVEILELKEAQQEELIVDEDV